jgi:hypothetical protein
VVPQARRAVLLPQAPQYFLEIAVTVRQKIRLKLPTRNPVTTYLLKAPIRTLPRWCVHHLAFVLYVQAGQRNLAPLQSQQTRDGIQKVSSAASLPYTLLERQHMNSAVARTERSSRRRHVPSHRLQKTRRHTRVPIIAYFAQRLQLRSAQYREATACGQPRH